MHPKRWDERAMRHALEAAGHAGTTIIGKDGRQVFVSAKFCEMVGWSREELVGSAPPFVYWPPEEHNRIREALTAATGPGAGSDGLELRFQRRNGERFDVCVFVSPVQDEPGLPRDWLAVVADITNRKRIDRHRTAEHEVVGILGSTPTLIEAAPKIIRIICAQFGWDAGVLWRVSEATMVPLNETWVGPHASDAMSGPRSVPPGEGLPGRVWQLGEPLWVSDLSTFDGFLRGAEAGAEGLRSAFAFPLKSVGGISGVLEFFSRETRPPDQDQLRTAASLGRQIGQYIDHEAAQSALRHNEERYRTIVEAANEGIWLVDRQGRTVYANRRLAEMLGVTTAELEHSRLADFCFPEDVAAARQRIAINLRGRSEQFDFRLRRRDDAELLVLVSSSPMQDGTGHIVGALAMFSDVTDRRRADEAVQRLAAIVQSSDDAIIGKNLDGIIQSWNLGAERIYGYSDQEAIGQPMTMLLPPDRPDEESAILSRLHRGERVDHFETVRLRKDGRLIDVSMTISPIRDELGRITGASSVTRDITERRRFEEQIRETQKLESLGVLAGGVAHDFNNLLVGIMGNASLALETLREDHPARRMLEGVLQASERATSLTQQLLAYSGKGRFVVQPIDMSQLIREIVALIQTSISKSVRVRFELDDNLPPIDADVAQIQQLVMNLVINGAEAIGDASGIVTIRTAVESRDGHDPGAPDRFVRLEVEDTGCGMDPATRERMFDPFFTTKFTGRGLGLAAALGIVRGHRGEIEVDSTPGQGTRFRVVFPASRGAAAQAASRSVTEVRGGHGTVLVVDDEEIVRATAQATLERYGYEVLLAADGEEALACLRRAPQIEVVLLDLTMPVMSGEEALYEMRRMRPDLRVVLSSGYNEVEAIRRFEGQGLSGFLQKPYTSDVLAEKMRSVMAARAGG
ncbi:MAG TPA: PAS domain S-box protein [Bryobacteraceae bacterium]|nr:PAS domain S-box protein [Bryobacteraceae bacterium]